jgi:hypothetical protein
MPDTPERALPVRAALHPDGLYLALRDIAPAELQDAFMQETVVRNPGPESVVRIDRQDLGKVPAGAAPAGVIFHVARCGSTLIAQLLKQHGAAVVYAEPLPVNELLLPPHRAARGDIVAALRSLGDAFARHAGRPYVLKLSSWNTLFCDLVADAFPHTPWALSLRDPLEVGVSLERRPPGWLRNATGPIEAFRPFIDPEGGARSPAEYVARLYAAFCDAAGRLDARRGLRVPYESLPAAAWESVAPHFGLPADAGARQRMAQAAAFDSKAPVGASRPFAPDDAAKRAAATPALRAAVDAVARPALERLAGIRASPAGS